MPLRSPAIAGGAEVLQPCHDMHVGVDDPHRVPSRLQRPCQPFDRARAAPLATLRFEDAEHAARFAVAYGGYERPKPSWPSG